MSKSFHMLLVLSVTVLVGCSGGGGGGGGGGAPAGDAPKGDGDVISKLSPTHRQNFENWKQQIVKSCNASEAFGLGQSTSEPSGIDGKVLLQKNENSVVFSEKDNLAILSSSTSFSGRGTTKFEQSEQINGQGYSISAETTRSGSNCVVSLSGEKVYETYIGESLSVGSHWAEGKLATATSAVPKIRALGVAGSGELAQHGIYSLVSQALRPSSDAISMIARKLGLEPEAAAKYIKLSGSGATGSALRLTPRSEGENLSVWNSIESGNLIAQLGVLQDSFDGNVKSLPIEIRLAIPGFSFAEAKNIADQGNTKFALNILVSKANETSFSYSAQSASNQGLVAFDSGESAQCVRDRAQAYVGDSRQAQIQPALYALMSPCAVLFRDIEKLSYESGQMKLLIPQMFAGVSPAPGFQYNGWDEVLSKLALEILMQQKDISSELDPESRTKIVGVVASYLQAIQAEIAKTKNMSTFKDGLFAMGLKWSFSGENITPRRIAQIIQPIDNAIVPFAVSSEKLLFRLGAQPNSSQDELFFAQGLDDDYKAEANKTLALAVALGYQDFILDVFNQVLQKKPAVDEFKKMTSQLSKIQNQIVNYANIDKVKKDLVRLSVRWLESGEASTQDLGLIYSAVSKAIDPFEKSTEYLMGDLSRSLVNSQESLTFARSISDEYKELALLIRENSKLADHQSWGETFFNNILQDRPELNDLRAWSELWVAVLGFSQREKVRTQDQVGGGNNDWYRKKVIETAVKETWSDAEFTGLEVLAEVALAKSACGSRKGYSTLADCAGLNLFSKSQGMFFDPSFAGRYIELGKDFKVYMGQLSSSNGSRVRRMLIDALFGTLEPIWSKCSQSSMSQKASALKTQVNALVTETDFSKRRALERQIEENIRNCD